MSTWVDTAEGLRALVVACRAQPLIAVDTEFMRGGTFYPQPCLLQIGFEGTVWLVDLLAGLDLEDLGGLFGDDSVVPVFHACGEDLEILRLLGLPVSPRLFDTQVAASLTGIGFNLSLQTLVQNLLGQALPKDATRTDWSKRPLLEDQLHYAAADVEHLPALHERLVARLEELDRSAWFAEEMQTLCNRGAGGEEVDSLAYLKFRGGWLLPLPQQVVLRNLLNLRDRWARHHDVPRRWLCSDDALLNLARRCPMTLAQVQREGEIAGRWLDSFGREVLEGLSRWLREPLPEGFLPIPGPLPKEARGMLDAVREAVGEVARERGLPEGLLANRAAIEATVRWLGTENEPLPPLLTGWRGELLRERMMQLQVREKSEAKQP